MKLSPKFFNIGSLLLFSATTSILMFHDIPMPTQFIYSCIWGLLVGFIGAPIIDWLDYNEGDK
jgi:uncharacterized membrane protein